MTGHFSAYILSEEFVRRDGCNFFLFGDESFRLRHAGTGDPPELPTAVKSSTETPAAR